MDEKLQELYKQSVAELRDIGLDVNNTGKIEISLSKRKNKRYGCCRQEEPEETSKYIEKVGRRKIIKYGKFKKHHIEISSWLMELDENIIKNTVIHEIIHCFPYCNNHGKEFKKYAKYINEKLGYNISRVGNKKEDYIKSNVEYKEKEEFNYHIKCTNCGQSIYRKRLNKNFVRKFKCGKCGGKFSVENIIEKH